MKIRILDGENGLEEYTLSSFNKEVVSFGRNHDNDIVLKSKYVSRVHGCFYLENGAWFIQDLDSSYGIYNGAERIKSAKLRDGMLLRISIDGKNVADYVELRVAGSNGAISEAATSVKNIPVSTPKSSVSGTNTEGNNMAEQTEEKKVSGLCVASLIFGILSLLTVCTFFGGIVFGALGGIFGINGMKSCDKNGKKGKGMGIAGMVCALVTLAILLIIACIYAANAEAIENFFSFFGIYI